MLRFILLLALSVIFNLQAREFEYHSKIQPYFSCSDYERYRKVWKKYFGLCQSETASPEACRFLQKSISDYNQSQKGPFEVGLESYILDEGEGKSSFTLSSNAFLKNVEISLGKDLFLSRLLSVVDKKVRTSSHSFLFLSKIVACELKLKNISLIGNVEVVSQVKRKYSSNLVASFLRSFEKLKLKKKDLENEDIFQDVMFGFLLGRNLEKGREDKLIKLYQNHFFNQEELNVELLSLSTEEIQKVVFPEVIDQKSELFLWRGL